MKRKGLAIAGLVAGLSVLTSMTAFAGEWKQDSNGWWWQNDDGSYPVSTWQWIDGNNDGFAERYYFNEAGYLATNTTIDDYTVNADGAWTAFDVIQRKPTGANGEAVLENGTYYLYQRIFYDQDTKQVIYKSDILDGTKASYDKLQEVSLFDYGRSVYDFEYRTEISEASATSFKTDTPYEQYEKVEDIWRPTLEEDSRHYSSYGFNFYYVVNDSETFTDYCDDSDLGWKDQPARNYILADIYKKMK